jgi:hypothetical protein
MNSKPPPLEQALINRYSDLYAGQNLGSDWLDYRPAVPFVGSEYGSSKPRILVYGSAENLTHEPTYDLMTFSRNREAFESWRTVAPGEKQLTRGNRFPWLHMEPVRDGTLPTAARYLLEVFNLSGFATDPAAFLQEIVIGNYGKFSLQAKRNRNRDYASDSAWLAESRAYVEADLEVLAPSIVIVPWTIYQHGFAQVLQRAPARPPRVWRIYQTNAQVINVTVSRQLNAAGVEPLNDRPTWVKEWVSLVTRARMDRYLDWVDWRAGRSRGRQAPEWYIEARSAASVQA